MLRIGIVPALLALVLACALASSADAQKSRRTITSEGVEGRVQPGSGGGAFGAVVDQLVRGCSQRGTELVNWPFDDIARIADPDELQRRALEALRGAAKEAAERLASDCPQQVPAAPSARLEAVEQGIDIALAAFATLQPALTAFYGALDDEQKARLLRDLTMSDAPARSAERTRVQAYQRSAERRERRSPGRAPAQTRDVAGGTQPNDRMDRCQPHGCPQAWRRRLRGLRGGAAWLADPRGRAQRAALRAAARGLL